MTHATRRNVPDNVIARVNAEISRCIKIAEDLYDRKFEFPTVKYNKRGRTAGTACSSTYTIDINSVLLMENLDTFIDGRDGRGTVTHEFAHLVDAIVNPQTRNRGYGRKRSIHGPTWARIMRQFGAKPSRCHSYDTTNSRVKKRGAKAGTITVKCSCGCGVTGRMGAKRVAKWRAKPNSFWFHRGHALIEVKPAVQKVAVAASAPKAYKAPKKGTKLETAVKVLREFFPLPKDKAIELIQDACGMTKAGATTYYYQARKLV